MNRMMKTCLGVALMAMLAFGLAGCALNCPPVEEGMSTDKDQTIAEGDWAGSEDLEALKRRVAELERRADETHALAEQANMTAEKALKCCRKEYAVIMTEEIYFDFNKFNIREDAQPVLARVAEKLKSDPDLIAELHGHTDGVGGVDYNIVLGQKRADAGRMWLIEKNGINMGRLAIRTFGKEAPVATNDTDPGRQKNRRVTIDILGFAQ
jgi:outer membrane protein OmpA-like peptidoglycan-associated protein